MPLTHNEILEKNRSLLKDVPFRSNFERENFLYGSASGPRLIVVLLYEIEGLNNLYLQSEVEFERDALLKEMNIISVKIDELSQELNGDLVTALEEAEPAYWAETLARTGAVEAICQEVSIENMSAMLKLPADIYEETITKCQSFLNVINKTTRLAERKANLANVPSDVGE
jgi:hypothetical protein